MPDCYLVIARGGAGVSTPQAYRDLDALYGDFAQQCKESEQRLERVLSALQSGDVAQLASTMYNIFESAVLPVHDVAGEIKQCMLSGGAIGAMMSGSGPSIVGIFDSEDKARAVRDTIAAKGIVAHVCKPVNPN
jgi:4-diphosphocytidyl-2-C-methyl-D-erythritol kinase